jgi:hypothetical protein
LGAQLVRQRPGPAIRDPAFFDGSVALPQRQPKLQEKKFLKDQAAMSF